jgi:hypothetical protein
MLSADLHYALDPVAFAQDHLAFNPDPWQEKALQFRGRQLILNCSRQSGKSTTAAILALHKALFYPGSMILLVSCSLRQSSELFRKVTEALRALQERPRLKEDNRLSLTLANGSRIVSLPSTEATIRGYSHVDLLIVDEAARVSDNLYYSVRPMLAVSGGQIILMSTPFGKRGFFHSVFTEGQSWERIEIPASECPRITAAFLEEERLALGEWWFLQEYCCRFQDTVDSVFASDDIFSAFSSEIEPLIFGGAEQ